MSAPRLSSTFRHGRPPHRAWRGTLTFGRQHDLKLHSASSTHDIRPSSHLGTQSKIGLTFTICIRFCSIVDCVYITPADNGRTPLRLTISHTQKNAGRIRTGRLFQSPEVGLEGQTVRLVFQTVYLVAGTTLPHLTEYTSVKIHNHLPDACAYPSIYRTPDGHGYK